LTHPLAQKTTQTIGVMLVVLAVPYTTPKLRMLRVVRAPWDHTEEDAVSQAPVVPPPVTTVGEQKIAQTENNGTVTNALPQDTRTPLDAEDLAKAAGSVAIVDSSGAMSAFYKQLGRTIRGEPHAITRVLHYGDSVVASDLISGTMRRRMQEKFGDSGHGFILIANPWQWYYHNDVGHRASEGWSMSRITGPLAKDGMYGLGGVSFHTAEAANASFNTVVEGNFGNKVTRFDVYYLEQPGGGDFQLEVKDIPHVRVHTAGDAKVSKKATIDVAGPDGGRASMTVRALGGGDVRMFGVVMERDVPGVQYDSLGALGGRANLWGQVNKDHWKEQIALRDPALLVFQYGTNESEDGGVNEPLYRKWVGDLIDAAKVAAPNASILVMAPPDRAEKADGGELRSSHVIVRIVELQEEIAKEHGVAFWNTWKAMGGKGSMGKWVKRGLANADLTHPTPSASVILGDLMFKAVMAGYDAYASTHPDAPVIKK
jgi:hypothetical protein